MLALEEVGLGRVLTRWLDMAVNRTPQGWGGWRHWISLYMSGGCLLGNRGEEKGEKGNHGGSSTLGLMGEAALLELWLNRPRHPASLGLVHNRELTR